MERPCARRASVCTGAAVLPSSRGRRVARHHDAVRREIRGQGPAVLPFPGHDLAGILRRPADLRRLPHLGAQFFGEIAVGVGEVRARKGLERGRVVCERRVPFALQVFVDALADHGPVAQVVRNSPDQADISAAQFGDLALGRYQKRLRGLAHFAGQYHQELASAARAEQDPREPQLGQQGARQHFAQKGNPLRPAGQQIFARRTRGTSFGGSGQEELLRAQDFSLQQDLFGHRTRKALRNPNFSTEF